MPRCGEDVRHVQDDDETLTLLDPILDELGPSARAELRHRHEHGSPWVPITGPALPDSSAGNGFINPRMFLEGSSCRKWQSVPAAFASARISQMIGHFADTTVGFR
jgi:hypothetical protein